MDGCNLGFKKRYEKDEPLDLLNLPALKLVTNGIKNVIFARSLTTGDEAKDKELKNILYSVNSNGRSGIDEIKDAFVHSLLYGKGLLLFNPVNEQMYSVSPFRYQPYYFRENSLVKNIVMYRIFDDESQTVYKEPVRVYSRYEHLVAQQTPQGLFISERIAAEFFERLNPLNTDRRRCEIVLTMMNEILSDLQTGGYGYVLVYGDGSYIGGQEVSDGEEFNRVAHLRSTNDRKQEVEDMLDGIMTGSRKGGQYFDGWVKEVEQLKRAVTPKDYEYFISKSQQISCEILGIPPVLLGLNESSRNLSVEALLNQANDFYTMPERQKVENYVSKILAPFLQVEKVYFDEEVDEQLIKEEN